MRRTKAESEATRRTILAAARRVFARRGVTRTTWSTWPPRRACRAARSTGTLPTRPRLFDAMRLQVSVPLIDRTDFTLLASHVADPLAAVERFLRNLLDTIANDSDTRQTFRIMMLKCEYVDEFEPELARQTKHWRELEAKLKKVYARARRAGTLRAGLAPAMAALDTCVFVSGLMRLWLLDERARADPHACATAHRRARGGSSGDNRSLVARAESCPGTVHARDRHLRGPVATRSTHVRLWVRLARSPGS